MFQVPSTTSILELKRLNNPFSLQIKYSQLLYVYLTSIELRTKVLSNNIIHVNITMLLNKLNGWWAGNVVEIAEETTFVKEGAEVGL